MNGTPKSVAADRRGVQPGNIFGAAPVAAACTGGDAEPVNNSAAASQPVAALRDSRRGTANPETSRASRDAPLTTRICHIGAPETIRPAGKPEACCEWIEGSESFFMTRESRTGSEPSMNGCAAGSATRSIVRRRDRAYPPACVPPGHTVGECPPSKIGVPAATS